MDTFKYNNLVSSRNHNPLFCFLSFFQIYKKYKSFNTTILFPLGILFGYNKEKLTAALSKHYGVKLLIIISVSIALLLLNSYALRTFKGSYSSTDTKILLTECKLSFDNTTWEDYDNTTFIYSNLTATTFTAYDEEEPEGVFNFTRVN